MLRGNARLGISFVAAYFALSNVPVLQADEPGPLEFEVTFPKSIRAEPFTGRVILFLSDNLAVEPRQQFDWTSKEPIFGQDVKDWQPDTPLRISHPIGYPFELKDLPAKRYRVQAVMHTNPDEPHSGKAPGNLYGKSKRISLDPAKSGVVKLSIDKKLPIPKEEESTARGKLVKIRSRCLSEFFKRDVYVRAMVVLPDEYEKEPERRFPAMYVIPGFGGDHREAASYSRFLGTPSTPFIRIGLDATSPHGHHVFADSDNCGPCGRALVEELIPHLEKTFRLIPEPYARLLTGHSSGGWSSLWLQISYPDYFGGTWSSSPDSVTFQDFCGIDLYDPKSNFFTDSSGNLRPVMRMSGRVVVTMKDFAAMEEAVGPGGQLHSFEAVFGPRGEDGRPKRVFDRTTGKIDPDVLKAWRRYDIVDKLDREWKTLGPKLKGKIHVVMGAEDTFYLNGATKILKQKLKSLDSDAEIKILEGKDHFNITFAKPFRAMVDQMSEQFTKAQAAARRKRAA